MSLHDDYARTTPLELAFPDDEAQADLFRSIAEEADARGADATDLQAFMLLDRVGAALRELRPAELGGEAIHRYGVLFQQAYLFHTAGSPLYLLTTGAVRYLVDGGPAVERVELPSPAGYVQFPQHLFWVDVAGHPESVDGMFWHLGGLGLIHLLMAHGLRGDRPGLGVVPVAEAPWTDASLWLTATVRAEGSDFATTLPGGDLEGLHSFVAAGEPLKLFARMCAYLMAFPDAVVPGVAPTVAAGAGPLPSRFPYRRIGLDRG